VAPSPASEVIAHHPAIASCAPSLESLVSAAPIDVAICYNSGAYWRELIQAARLGIPNRVGYVHKGFSGLVTHRISINYPQPYPFYFRDLVGQVTGRTADWAVRPVIYPGPDDEAQARRVWQEAGFNAVDPVIACFMTSRQASGVCPPEKFAEGLACLEARGSVQTVICGTAADGETLERLKAAFALQARIVAGKLSLLSLGCFLRRCAVVLCPDSGPRHLANAVGRPVVFVRNLAVGKIETGAYLESEIDAAPDSERLSPMEQAGAFALLKPEALAARVLRLLDPA
jgi:ADP-heptose:LPS heptosyltransferase